jgi:hypothetical protein
LDKKWLSRKPPRSAHFAPVDIHAVFHSGEEVELIAG